MFSLVFYIIYKCNILFCFRITVSIGTEDGPAENDLIELKQELMALFIMALQQDK